MSLFLILSILLFTIILRHLGRAFAGNSANDITWAREYEEGWDV